MAETISKLKDEFTKLNSMAGKFGLNGAKAAYAELDKAYKEVLKGEDKVIKALPAARKAGVTGDDIKSFLRDPTFKKIFKEYDKTVDDLDKAEKVCYEIVHHGDEVYRDLDQLEKRLRKDFKDLKDKVVAGLLKDIDGLRKRAAAASDSFDMKGADKKMHEYATKFDKRVQFMLDLAPKSEKPPELPADLDDSAIKSAEKDCLKQEKELANMAKKVATIIKAITPFTRKGDLMCQKEVGEMEKLYKRMQKTVQHYDKLIKDNKKEIMRGHEKVDINAFFKTLQVKTEAAELSLKHARADLLEAQKSIKATS